MLKLDFGLWARVSQRFCPILSPRSIFPTAQRFSRSNHVTSGLGHVTLGDVTSGSGHVISGHFRFRWRHFRLSTQTPLSNQKRSAVAFPVSNSENQSEARTGGVYANYRGKFAPMGPPYYSHGTWNASTQGTVEPPGNFRITINDFFYFVIKGQEIFSI